MALQVNWNERQQKLISASEVKVALKQQRQQVFWETSSFSKRKAKPSHCPMWKASPNFLSKENFRLDSGVKLTISGTASPSKWQRCHCLSHLKLYWAAVTSCYSHLHWQGDLKTPVSSTTNFQSKIIFKWPINWPSNQKKSILKKQHPILTKLTWHSLSHSYPICAE